MATAVLRGNARPVRRTSMQRDRKRALLWSYVFLFVFVIFFLTPPVYMLITSLKTSAEISAGTAPWWVSDPTIQNYVEILTSPTYLTFFRNSALVSVLVVAITMLVSIPAAFALSRMKFWGSATLATGVFLTYLIPDTLLFIPLFKIFVYLRELTGIEFINHWWVLVIIYPTLTVPFCTWIMIGYFGSIPKELDEAALMDGAGYLQTLTKIFIPVALHRIVRQLDIHRSVETVLGVGVTMLGGVGLVALSIALILPVTAASEALAREDLVFALSVVLLGLLMMITRRNAIAQVVGFMSLENGLILAATGAKGMPLVVEISVAFSILIAFIVIGIFLFRIRERFDTVDISALDRFRGERQ